MPGMHTQGTTRGAGVVWFFAQHRNQNKSTEGTQSQALLLTTGKSQTNYSN